MIRLYTADLTPLDDGRRLEYHRARMSPARQEKFDRLRQPDDRRRCVGAALLLEHGLREWGLHERDRRYAVLDGGKCILQLRGVRPFLSDKYDITHHPNYKYLSDYDKRNEFNIEKFLSTKLNPKPDEAYEVFEVDASKE